MAIKEHTVTIMDIPFINCTQEQFIHEKLLPMIDSAENGFIVTANPEIVMETRQNLRYKEIVQAANYVVPDGIGIILAAKRKKQPLHERIAGFDLMNDMLKLAAEKGLRCFFLGASDEVNERAVEEVKRKYPNIHIAGQHHGYFDITDGSVAEYVKKTRPNFIFVALGFPKQEEWIARYLEQFSKGIFIGVGGSFDVLAGNVKRAPAFWINLHLEWLYRLLKQPFRVKRMAPIITFMWLVLWKKI